MDHRTNRTFICSVLFVDIVAYSTKPVEDQILLKERFNAFLAETIKDIAVNDRIILDTGDGAALGFLGDPEDALFVAMELRDSVLNEQRDPSHSFSLRMGIHLGPVKLVKDINNQLNLIGDGINVAQRIMSFAEPGQLFVSRSYYEVISCLSQEYAKLFSDEGIHADKHIRKHRIYAVGHYESKKASIAGVPQSPPSADEAKEAAVIHPSPPPQGSQPTGGQSSVYSGTLAAPPTFMQRLSGRKWLFAAFPLVALVALVTIFALRGGKGTTEIREQSNIVASSPKPQPMVAKKADAPGSPLPTPSAPSAPTTPVAPPTPLASKKVATIGFTLAALERKGRDIVVTMRLKNSAAEERSVALYDASYSWTKSHLSDEGGRSHDVQEVYYRKGGKKITMYDTGKTGIPVGGGATVTITLVFKNIPDGSREATLNIHPFIYHGRSWTEHDMNFQDVSLR
jgi:class 3 adenylate cyclase